MLSLTSERLLIAVAFGPVLLPENPMDGGAWWAVVHGVAESWT